MPALSRALLPATLLLSLTAAAEETPAPLAALEAQGLTVHGRFAAPGGLTGYAASARGRPMTVFVTADGEHAVIGNLVDTEGNNLSEAPLDRLVRAPQEAETWQALQDSAWIADGDADATRTVYVFTDPNCPYCRRFWQAARPWVEAGRVRLRHVMVGILEHDSPRLAVSLLAAADPAAALAAHERGDGIEPLEPLPRRWELALQENHGLMERLGLVATPGLVYRVDDRLQTDQGMPSEERLTEILGPRP
ncbi:thiol:disulfide interchange protein DsbG [Halomonas beimenensis]|uniref:Thiol:disulfide interchange protein n=1 Tax=Halomonas beimenensis TaxID=475662 RepID=A0A291PAE7_9GAMM|nr:thiol:disulfide interchange protein DsbG [Halomonas beimenensis]ATJ83845.1 thiol:disulfide interchange protein DsbG precursor [Halomonas beimenensis]